MGLVTAKVNAGYQQDFRNIAMQFFDDNDFSQWVDIYKKLTFWETKMEENEDSSMEEVLASQLSEANTNFGRFVASEYLDWLHTKKLSDRPMLSPDVIPQTTLSHIGEGYESVF